MKLLSDAAEYALRAVLWLAERPGEAQKVRQIAQGTQAAPGYLVKVLQGLTRAGILSAQRGSHGGFTLLRDPARLSVLEVIEAIDPIERISCCPLGIAAHQPHLCSMHRRIDEVVVAIHQAFAHATIAELLVDPHAPRPMGLRCSGAACGHATP